MLFANAPAGSGRSVASYQGARPLNKISLIPGRFCYYNGMRKYFGSKQIVTAIVIFITVVCLFGIVWLLSDRIRLEKELSATKQQLTVAQTESACTARDTWQSGSLRAFHTESSGKQRTYYVHLPSNFSKNISYPALLAFTGKGGDALQFAHTIGLNDLPAIIIYPAALPGTEGVTAWEGAPYSPKTNDVQFISDILDRLEGQLCIQKSRIYSVGLSNGGGLSWLLSCQMSDRIAAFGMISGAFYSPMADCHSARPAAIINIHGDHDLLVPYDGSSQRKLPKISTWIKQRAKDNACKTAPTVTKPNASTEVTTWSGCAGGATVQNIRLIGAGHGWPSSVMFGAGKKASLQETNDVLWNFFVSHPMP